MAPVTAITSSSHLSAIISSSSYVVMDFYADWCGPCKMISPVFEQLAQSEAKPGKLVFVKVDVDSQQDIARQYGISAMPTFLILRNGVVSDTVKGANAAALRAAIMSASSAAAQAPAKQSSAFSTKGYVLGGTTLSGASATSTSTTAKTPKAAPATAAATRTAPMLSGVSPSTSVTDDITRFVALYLTTLFSFDANAAAATSPFSRVTT